MLVKVLTVLAVSVVATAALAQSNPIAERKALMKAQGAASRDAAAMVKGEAPFDAAKAQGVFDAYLSSTAKFADLFPADTKTGGETRAAAKIWDDNAGFRAAIAKFETDVKAAKASTKDFESFKTAFNSVGQNCGSCHETYRTK